MTTFNEFQRELRKRNISPENAYMFTLVYERLAHIMVEHEQMAKALVAIANNVQGFVSLREDDRKQINNILRKLGSSGVDVHSEEVGNDPGRS